MGLKYLRQHGGVLLEYFPHLRFVRNIDNAQAALIVYKRTAHDEPLVSLPPLTTNLLYVI